VNNATASSKYRLSKSKIAAFEHCPKRLWLQIHRRHVGRFDADTLTRFQFGHDVGARARFVIPEGVMVEDVPDMQAALDRTAELIARRPIQPIFEATFQREDVLVRVDILEPDAQGGWRAIEVKASSRVRAYHLADLATQVWVMQGCGVTISRAIMRHLAGPIAWRRPDVASVRFQDADVTTSIRRYVASRAAVAAAARGAIRGPDIKRDMGTYCQRPFSCEFQAYCNDLRSMPLLAMT
jgi:hypothetical protein